MTIEKALIARDSPLMLTVSVRRIEPALTDDALMVL
jgi:hypothetical protein